MFLDVNSIIENNDTNFTDFANATTDPYDKNLYDHFTLKKNSSKQGLLYFVICIG